ncbi:alpha/beta hydrolase-fold protein [Aquimarina pacifica]|uniref:alpha/beta hydrolase-fold protein n=1 Tax=Aquimarina pacifica TaxID=1296415 RepID=UPI000472F8FB|nr:alpha/beta hydrolase-fold protein [Aquimarina pacifica]
MNLLKYKVLFCLIFSLSQISLQAQEQIIGEIIEMKSEILNESRKLQILLPKDFEPNKKKYSVFYLLDGKKRISHTKATLDFLTKAKMTPDYILVGIINVDRNRDFLPTYNEIRPTSGKADQFLSYLEEEVKPYIISKYGQNNTHILTGHSFGGLLSMYTLLTKPTLFDGYISSDPSFWWDKGYILKLAKTNLPKLKGMSQVLFISGREGAGMEQMGISKMKQVLETLAPDDMDWKIEVYQNESHKSITYKAYYDGIRFVEKEYASNDFDIHPMHVHMVEGKPVQLRIFENSSGIHYTLNGKEPTVSDPMYKDSLLISQPGTVKFSKVSKRKNAPKSKTIDIKLSQPQKALPAKKVKKLQQGLQQNYYEGVWDVVPDFSSLEPLKKSIASSSFDLKELPKKENFGCLYNGYFEAKTTGYHYFFLGSGDGIKMYLGDSLFLDNDGIHSAKKKISGVMYLEKGYHPIRFEYFQRKNKRKIEVFLYTPNTMENIEKLPFEQLFHK